MIDLLAEAAEAVEARAMFAWEFEDLEETSGFKHNVEGVLADAELNEMNWTHLRRVDWVHIDLQHGPSATEIKALMIACVTSSISRFRANIRKQNDEMHW